MKVATKEKRENSMHWPWLVALVQVVNGLRSERNYLSLPEVRPLCEEDLGDGSEWPGISIIVPARNEASNLPCLLDSLPRQDYPSYEIVVVDDGSTDTTPQVVARFAAQADRVRLIESRELPPGWTGKNHACWVGARQSNYPWLLFVDADTKLAPATLRSTLALAHKRHAKALSLFPKQRCETLWERVLMPFAIQQFFVGINVRRIHSPYGPALANGQFFLIERGTYQRCGGHAAIAGSVIDDVALAIRLKECGEVPIVCRGEHLVSVRMYTGLWEIARGFGKNSYLVLRKDPLMGVQIAASTWLAASVPFLLIDAWRKRSLSILALALLAYCAQVLGLEPWARRFDITFSYPLLSPLSALTFVGVALNSMVRVLSGRALPSWKRRRYHPDNS